MIPKIIHYCWFGGNPIPKEYTRYMESWKKYCPDYKLKKWTEDNFNFDHCPYYEEALRKKKWAFASDYARFVILYRYGGIYLDTDVELIRNLDGIIKQGSFMGCEHSQSIGWNRKSCRMVNSGLGMGMEPGMPIVKEIINDYKKSHFYQKGIMDSMTVVERATRIMERHGFVQSPDTQRVENVFIYPEDYFCPLNYATGTMKITENTYSIHHYAESWHTSLENYIHAQQIKASKSRGKTPFLWKIYLLMLRLAAKIQSQGIIGTAKIIFRMLNRQ